MHKVKIKTGNSVKYVLINIQKSGRLFAEGESEAEVEVEVEGFVFVDGLDGGVVVEVVAEAGFCV